MLREGDDISALSNWNYDKLLYADQGRLSVLLYYDPVMAQTERSFGSKSYTMPQLLTLIVHQYPGIRFGGKGSRKSSLGPQCKQLETLRSVEVKGKMCSRLWTH